MSASNRLAEVLNGNAYRVATLARKAEVSPQTIRRQIRKRKVIVVLVGREFRVPASELPKIFPEIVAKDND